MEGARTMRHEREHIDSSLRAGDGPGSLPSVADASLAADNPARNTRRGSSTGGRATLNRRRRTHSTLDVVSQDGDRILDLTAVHDTIALLLVRYHQKVCSERVAREPT